MAQDMMLYWGSGSPPCWRAMLALEEKALQGYSHKLLSFSQKEHKGDEVKSINPRGQLPTFKHGDIVINESMAIVDYLEAVFPNQGTRLLPEDAAGKGFVLQRRAEALNLQKKGQEDLGHYLMRTKKEDQDPDVVKERVDNFRKELDIWEGYLKQQAGNGGYVCGKFSMADCILFPTLAIAVRFGLKLGDKWPHLLSYYTLMCERPSVKATWPPHWKDSEGPSGLAIV